MSAGFGLVRRGVTSIAKLLGSPLTGDVTLSEGANVTITQVGQNIAIAATGIGGGTPATTVTDETTFGVAKAVGTATNYAREDHTHGSEPHDAHGSLASVTADQHHAQAHHAAHEPSGADPMAVDAAAATGSLRTLGSGAAQAVSGTDSRLSDARTPTAHEATHELGGTDPVPTPLAPTTTVTIPSGHCAVVAGRYYVTASVKLVIADTARFAIV